jgi:hypothetical protein
VKIVLYLHISIYSSSDPWWLWCYVNSRSFLRPGPVLMVNSPGTGLPDIPLLHLLYVNMDATCELDSRRIFFTPGPSPQLTEAAGTYASVFLSSDVPLHLLPHWTRGDGVTSVTPSGCLHCCHGTTTVCSQMTIFSLLLLDSWTNGPGLQIFCLQLCSDHHWMSYRLPAMPPASLNVASMPHHCWPLCHHHSLISTVFIIIIVIIQSLSLRSSYRSLYMWFKFSSFLILFFFFLFLVCILSMRDLRVGDSLHAMYSLSYFCPCV